MEYTINEIKDYINNFEYYGDFDDFDLSKFEKLNVLFKETIKTDEHRWYVVETNVYEFFNDKKGESLGLLAIDEVGMLKSEMMSVEDCFHKLKAYNVKEVVKTTYELV